VASAEEEDLAIRNPSAYQKAVFEDFKDSSGNTVVEAYAGCAKTSTMIEGAKLIPRNQRTLFCAFNKPIQRELERKVDGHADARTLHSLGLRAIRRECGSVKIDENKTKDLCKALLIEEGLFFTKQRNGSSIKIAIGGGKLAKLVGYAKNVMIEDHLGLMSLARKLRLDEDERLPAERLAKLAATILKRCGEITDVVDFDDMIWFPARLGLKPRIYDCVIIDETQDLNPAQLYLAKSLARVNGRIVAVGDRYQSIYQFRGADADAMPRMISELDAKVLPLSVTYRCPTSVVEVAQRIVPGIEAAPGAKEGTVRSTDYNSMLGEVQPGDFVLSRTKAPLVRGALAVLKSGKPARVAGRDLGRNLGVLIEKSKASNATELCLYVKSWAEAERARYLELDEPEVAEQIGDQAETVLALADGCSTVHEIESKMRNLFDDRGPRDVVLFSSTHRAKGLERPRVFMLPTFKPDSEWQEERNIYYVAVTRCSDELVFVRGEEE
jgi:superfamily I DNA/RNA helicase